MSQNSGRSSAGIIVLVVGLVLLVLCALGVLGAVGALFYLEASPAPPPPPMMPEVEVAPDVEPPLTEPESAPINDEAADVPAFDDGEHVDEGAESPDSTCDG